MGLIALLTATPLAFAAATLPGQTLGGAPAGLRMPVCPKYEELCVNAERTGVFDMKAGTAELEGNVTGYMESQEMLFHADLLRAFRNDAGDWQRLLLSNQVRIAQPNRTVSADHGVIEKETALFYGNAHMSQGTGTAESDEVYLERETERATLRGTAATPVRMQFIPERKEDLTAQMAGSAPGEAPPPEPTRASAQKSVVEEQSRQVTLTGTVNVDIPDRQIHLQAESVVLQFADDNQVSGFTARGDVVITQPGRRLTSDSARSQNRMQTILLQGRARAQQEGQFDLTSDRMEVFTDPKKGTVRSEDRQRPISTSLDLQASKPYKLDQPKLQELVNKGVPPATLQKLDPIVGKTYNNQEAFRRAVAEVLTAEESQRYLSIILAQAR
jgi:lipopolysaccharide export system protein LptA